MATATVARPSQAIRNRRDPPRLSLGKRQNTMDGPPEGQPDKKRRLNEPYVRTSQYILRKHQGKPPSLIIHLHQTHFRFDEQDGSFAYDSPMKFILQHLRKQTVPHEMLEELLANNVPFYDGCLIVEVHNHRAKEGKEKGRNDSGPGDKAKFSMHKYNEHITPSPMVPYPSNARTDGGQQKMEPNAVEMPAPEKPKEKDSEGPKITTLVLHPTQLTNHQEILILSRTPISDVRGKKKSADGATPSNAQPPTPQLSLPPTPVGQTARGAMGQRQKMCLEEQDFYTFQGDMLVATEPPLYLDSVDSFQDSQKVLDMLQHPLHQDMPPASKTRKRTTAEMAADDAQAAEVERRMLIMDERIKPSGTNTAANENQQAAASLGFSRFKTLEMVRQQHEEKARQKKEEEVRAANEKKQSDQEAQQAQQRALQQQRAHQLMQQQQQQQQQQNTLQQQQQQMKARALSQAQQQAQMGAQNHAHPQQGNMIANQARNFQHPSQNGMQQGSPIMPNQTPMMNSSPPLAQPGFPMAQTTSQGAGSPGRPTSASVQHPNPMARQVSQQQHPSRNNTPQIPQGTPNMAQAIPNRQMAQTPRMPPASPAAAMQQNTPTPVSMHLQTSQMGNKASLTPEQQMILAQQQAMQQAGAMQGLQGSQPQLTPEQFAEIQRRQQRNMLAQQQQAHAQALAQGQSAQMAQQYANQLKVKQMQIHRQQMMALQQHQQQQQQQQQPNGQMHNNAGQANSPGSMHQQTPQMGHAHPQQGNNVQDTPQGRAQLAQFRQQQQQHLHQILQPLVLQYGGLMNIPVQVLNTLPANAQSAIRAQVAKHRQMRMQQAQQAQQQAQQQQQQQQGGGSNGAGAAEQVPGSQPNPHYMQQLRNSQAQMLASQQRAQQMLNQQQQQQAGGGGGAMPFNMNALAMGQQMSNQGRVGGPSNEDVLAQRMAAMQNVINQNQQGGGGGPVDKW